VIFRSTLYSTGFHFLAWTEHLFAVYRAGQAATKLGHGQDPKATGWKRAYDQTPP